MENKGFWILVALFALLAASELLDEPSSVQSDSDESSFKMASQKNDDRTAKSNADPTMLQRIQWAEVLPMECAFSFAIKNKSNSQVNCSIYEPYIREAAALGGMFTGQEYPANKYLFRAHSSESETLSIIGYFNTRSSCEGFARLVQQGGNAVTGCKSYPSFIEEVMDEAGVK